MEEANSNSKRPRETEENPESQLVAKKQCKRNFLTVCMECGHFVRKQNEHDLECDIFGHLCTNVIDGTKIKMCINYLLNCLTSGAVVMPKISDGSVPPPPPPPMLQQPPQKAKRTSQQTPPQRSFLNDLKDALAYV